MINYTGNINYTNLNMVENCSVQLANYGSMIDGKIKYVIIGLAVMSILFYIILNKKMKDYKRGTTKSENYLEILKSLQMFASLLIIGTVFLVFSAFKLW